MSVKCLGRGRIDLDKELWFPEGKTNLRFHMNRRRIDLKPEMKALRKHAEKVNHGLQLIRRRPHKRQAYLKARDEFKLKFRRQLETIYREIWEESFSTPVLLRRARDYDHGSDWRYCLYQGNIYEFDKPDYSSEEMVSEIRNTVPLPAGTGFASGN